MSSDRKLLRVNGRLLATGINKFWTVGATEDPSIPNLPLETAASAPFSYEHAPNPLRRRQAGLIEVTQCLLLTTLVAAPAVDTVFREPLVTRVTARAVQQPQVLPNLVARHLGTAAQSGSGTPSLPLLTASGSGTKARAGTGAVTLPLLTASGSGSSSVFVDTVSRQPLTTRFSPRLPQQPEQFPNLSVRRATQGGSGSPTLPLLTASGTGTKARAGTGATTLPVLTASGTGTKARAGTGTPSLPMLTVSGSGTKARSGSGTPTLPLLTASGSGSVGTVVPLRPVDLTPSWTVKRAQQPTIFRPAPGAIPRHIGEGSPTLPLLTSSGSGTGGTESVKPFAQYDWWTRTRTAELHPSQDWINVLFRPAAPFSQDDWPNPLRRLFKQQPELFGKVLQVVAGTNSGSGAPSLPLLTASGTGTKARTGTGSPVLPLLTASGTGTKARAGTGAATLPLITASGAGVSSSPGTHSGSGDAVLPLLTASGVGSSVGVAQPSTGGWAAYNAYDFERRKRRLEALEDEDEADRLEALLIAEGQLPPNPVIDDRITVREYALQADFSRRTQRAIDYALRARTDLAYQLAAREIANQLEDEEYAILLLLTSL